jgi:hypothetical protein
MFAIAMLGTIPSSLMDIFWRILASEIPRALASFLIRQLLIIFNL